MKILYSLLALLLPMICLAQVDMTDSADPAQTDTLVITDAPVQLVTPEVTAPSEVPLVTQLISIGYLSYDSALIAMPDYAIAQTRLKQLREAYETELKRVEEEFNHKYEDFLEGQRDFPRTILLKRQTELQDMLQRNVEFKQQGLKDLSKAEAEAIAPLLKKLSAVIATVAKRKGLALVVNTDSNSCPFIDPEMGVDILPDVLRRLK